MGMVHQKTLEENALQNHNVEEVKTMIAIDHNAVDPTMVVTLGERPFVSVMVAAVDPINVPEEVFDVATELLRRKQRKKLRLNERLLHSQSMSMPRVADFVVAPIFISNVSFVFCLFVFSFVVVSSGPLSVSELADIIDEKPVSVIKFLMTDLGVMASMTQSLDPATCIAVVEGFGKIVGGSEEMDEEM